MPEPRPLTRPTWYAGNSTRLALTTIANNGASLRAAAWWLQRLLHSRLRLADAHTYTVQAETMSLAHGYAELGVLVDGVRESADARVQGVLQTMGLACNTRISEEELTAWRRGMTHALADPGAVLALLARAANSLLLGTPVRDGVALIEEAEAVTAESVNAELVSTFPSSLLELPVGATAFGGGWSPLTPRVEEPVHSGDVYVPARHRKSGARLTVGHAGVALQDVDGGYASALWQRTVAVLARNGGVRTFVDVEGDTLTIAANDWSNGLQLVDALDRHTRPELLIPMPEVDEPPPPAPQLPASATSNGMMGFLAFAASMALFFFVWLLTKSGVNKPVVAAFALVLAVCDYLLIRAFVRRMRVPKNQRPTGRVRSSRSVRFDATVAKASTGYLLPAAFGCFAVAILAVLLTLKYWHVTSLWLGIVPVAAGAKLCAEWDRRRTMQGGSRARRR